MARVLLLGSGGREHALAWAPARSPHVDELVCAPGNPGMEALGECREINISDPRAVADLADAIDADLVVIGPEDPAVAGVADTVSARGRLAFGPRAAAAQLEGSKAFMKDVLVAAEVATARHATFTSGEEASALAFLDTLHDLYVIKTDGLAGGKGVTVADSLADARAVVRDYLSGAAFGAAGSTCVIEQGMTGPEVSLFALCDGTGAVPFALAQDHKRAFDEDQGPNTGGMGAYLPVPFVPDDFVDEVMHRVIRPTLAELQRRGANYRGVLYCGLMLTPDGPRVIEYNVRFGDPECQVIMPLLESDLFAHCAEAAAGRIETPVRLRDEACVGVAVACDGYPPSPARRGDVIDGLDAVVAMDGVPVFHAGTRRDGDAIVTDGGRVLTVVATGAKIREARDRAYEASVRLAWPGLRYRHDIAAQALT